MAAVLHGAEELRSRLRSMADAMRREALEEAVLAGAVPIVEAARAAAPKEEGVLAFAIAAKLSPRQNPNKARARIGPQKASGARDPFYARWVEYGHWLVSRSKDGGLSEGPKTVAGKKRLKIKGKRLGFVRAKPFLRPALLTESQAAVDRMFAVLWRVLERQGAR